MGRSYSWSGQVTPGTTSNRTLMALVAGASELLTITEIFYGPRAAPSATSDVPHVFGVTTDLSDVGSLVDVSSSALREDPSDGTTRASTRLYHNDTGSRTEPTYGGSVLYRKFTSPAAGSYTWKGRMAINNGRWALRMLACTTAVETVYRVHWTEGML